MAIAIVTAVLVVALVLLVTERVPVDVTALGIIVVLAATGVLDIADAVGGFANPAVVTVGAMFLLSAGMIRTGALNFVGRVVMRLARGHHLRAMLMTLFVVGCASAFINNTPIVVLFMPIFLTMSCAYQVSPSKLLIPLSYASILGGTCTLIGTSTNIVVSDLAAAHGLGALSMFELSALGVPLALVGIAFICVAGPRLLPSHAVPICASEDRADRRYLAELVVPRGSELVGTNPFTALGGRFPGLAVFEVVRDHHIVYSDESSIVAAEGDVILAMGSPNDFVTLLERGTVALPRTVAGKPAARSGASHLVVELIIPPQSQYVGERLAETELFDGDELEVVAVRLRGEHHSEQKTRSLRLRVGTILLVQCSPKRFDALRKSVDVIVVEDVHHEILRRDKAWRAMVIFGAVVVAATTGLADIMLCALGGALLMILTGCVSLHEAYRSIQGQVLVLIAGTIALGQAMTETGAARLYADGVLALFEGMPPWVVLSAIIALTCVATQVLSNNATAVLLFPIALSAAEGLGVEARPFVIGVCFGASACFATPIGYQTNLLVYGPGGYRFTDYLKLGIPLNLLVWAIGTVFIPVIWPF